MNRNCKKKKVYIICNVINEREIRIRIRLKGMRECVTQPSIFAFKEFTKSCMKIVMAINYVL